MLRKRPTQRERAYYAVGGDGPTPGHAGYPRLHPASAAAQGRSADEMFTLYPQTYLDGIRREISGKGTELTPTAAE